MKIRFLKDEGDKRTGEEYDIDSVDYSIEPPKKTIENVVIQGKVFLGSSVEPVDF